MDEIGPMKMLDFFNIAQLSVQKNTKNTHTMHVKTSFLVLEVDGVSSIKRYLFTSSRKFGHTCECIWIRMLENLHSVCCEGPPASIALTFQC